MRPTNPIAFEKTAQHPYRHIESYDGHRWVSDFLHLAFRLLLPFIDLPIS